jgi:hypothetical protein
MMDESSEMAVVTETGDDAKESAGIDELRKSIDPSLVPKLVATENTKRKLFNIEASGQVLFETINRQPNGRNKSLALTHLEDAVMRAKRAALGFG